MARTWTPEQEEAMRIRGKTLLVSAAAGSGKTSVLTERIIRSLLDKEQPADLSRMLIVTFTRAAAAELKGRIAEALGKALAENPENEHLSHQLFLLGSAQISTIDSFFQKAVKANFEKLDIPATFRIANESEILPLKRELLEALIEEFYKKYTPTDSGDMPLSRIYKNDFAKAIDHLISNRSDGKLYDVLLQFFNCFSSDPAGIERLREYAEQLRLDADRNFFDTVWGKEALSRLEGAFALHLHLLRNTAEYLATDDYIKGKYGEAIYSDLEICEHLSDALSRRAYEDARRSAAASLISLPGGKINKTTQSIAYQTNRAKFKTDLGVAQNLLCYDAAQISEQCRESADTFEMLYEFFREYESRLMLEKRERGAFEYDDIRAMLYRLLNEEDGSPTPYAASLASQYDIVYIDEYQDVDLIQDRIFARVGGDRRFMVGDIKQSIYGFRGSDPSIFSEYRRSMPLCTEPQAETSKEVCVFMSSNFRCNDPVIRFANKVCAFLFSACKDSIDYRKEDDLGFAKEMPKTLPERHPVPVQVEVFEGKPRAKKATIPEDEEEDDDDLGGDEMKWVAAEIARLLREEVLDNGKKIQPSDVAVLTRSHKQNTRFLEAIADLGIPVSAAAQNNVLHDPLLTATLNLLRAVDNPYRDLPLTEFLLSEFGGFTLTEISEIREAGDKNSALYDALIRESEENGVHAEKAGQVLCELEALRRRAAVQPADRFLRLLYLEEKFVPYASTPPLLFLYDQARLCQRTAFCGIYGFLSHFTKVMEDGKVSADGFQKAESAVTVMTVHHSKGLEFPVVFFGGTGTGFNQEDLKKGLLHHRKLGVATKLYNRESGATESTAMHNALKLRIRTEQNEEEIRSLYVALTRARERLYVTGSLRGKFDSAIKSAAQISYGDRNAILGVSNSLKWILAALQTDVAEIPFTMKSHPFGSVEVGIPFAETSEDAPKEAHVESPRAAHYASIAERQASFDYPDAHLAGLPSKLAASNLHKGILDTICDEADADRALEAQIHLMRARPSFDTLLREDATASAVDIGTAMHAFLEFCDFAQLKKNGVKAECVRLVAMGFLSEETRTLLNAAQLEKFCESDLMHLILEAVECKREQKFSLMLPITELTEDPALAQRLAGECIFVQGSIDLLLLMPDGRRILVDYKTDRITAEERANPSLLQARLQRAHADQLSCYALAIRQLFGSAPDDVRIYSVPLGATVQIEVDGKLGN